MAFSQETPSWPFELTADSVRDQMYSKTNWLKNPRLVATGFAFIAFQTTSSTKHSEECGFLLILSHYDINECLVSMPVWIIIFKIIRASNLGEAFLIKYPNVS